MFKKIIKKIFQIIGIKISKYRPENNPLSFVKNYNITTVLDIGANIGEFSKEIREILEKTKIYSFEPIKDCFDKLNETMRGDENFQSFNFGLGECDCVIQINKNEYRPSSSIKQMSNNHIISFPHTKNSIKENIIIKKLDDFINKLEITENILTKIDVQGYEREVISGGLETIKKSKVLIIENSFVELYKDQFLFDKIYSKLKEIGFLYYGAIGSKKDPVSGLNLFEDSVFIKN